MDIILSKTIHEHMHAMLLLLLLLLLPSFYLTNFAEEW